MEYSASIIYVFTRFFSIALETKALNGKSGNEVFGSKKPSSNKPSSVSTLF